MTNVLYTIGHSTHSTETVIKLLRLHEIRTVADVRSHPYSRLNPQFNRESFSQLLESIGIRYVYLGRELGARPADPTCYVDGKVAYDLLAQTPLFRSGLDRVVQLASTHRVALMCAEKDPIVCHRAILICRHLVERGWRCYHILEDGRLESHDDALSRLLEELKLPTIPLFREVVIEAYSKRSQQIASTESFTQHTSVRRGER